MLRVLMAGIAAVICLAAGAESSAAPTTDDDVRAFRESVRRPSGSSAAAAADDQTYIESVPRGAAVVVEGEFVGEAPLYIDLRPFLRESRSGSVLIKAMPPGDGCVAVELITVRQRMPRRMRLDTRLCPLPTVEIKGR